MSGRYRGQLAPAAPRPAASGLQRQSSMLDVEFAQLSDPGRIREHNEDYLGHTIPDSPARARSHGWLFALADGVGGNEDGEVASRLAVGTLLAGFRERCRRRAACAFVTAPRTGRQRTCARSGTGIRIGRTGDGDHGGGLRAALRPRHRGARWRFAVLSDSPGPRDTADARPHLGERAGAAWYSVIGPGERIRFSPHAEPLAGKRTICQCRHQRAPVACRRCAFAKLRRTAWRGWADRAGQP